MKIKLKNNIKKIVINYPRTYFTIAYIYKAAILHLSLAVKIFKALLNRLRIKHKKPSTLQLPITYKCNFDCLMCGMRSKINNKDFTPEELSKTLSDTLFSEIRKVGVNGGEPFIKNNITDYIQVLMDSLPKLSNIYIITNGYFTEKIIEKLKVIKSMCSLNNIKVTVSLSIDGIEDIHDMVRGKKDAYKHAVNTLKKIKEKKDGYCDELNIICTITKKNIAYINEVDIWSKELGINVTYNIATLHKRINNRNKYKDFSIFTDEQARCMAAEFFYTKFLETRSLDYFAIYKFICTNKRISPCQHQYDVVTLTPNAQLSYCATNSKEIGNTFNTSAYELYIKNKGYKDELRKNYCDSCSHYISGLTIKGYFAYNKEILNQLFIHPRYLW